MLYTLSEVFEGRLFRIPGYQRGYSWEIKHFEQLLKDLDNVKYPFPEDSFHFTGTLTLNHFSTEDLTKLKTENHGYEINQNNKVVLNGSILTPFQLVDGQQRLTTVLILISILTDKILMDDFASLEDKNFATSTKEKFLTVNCLDKKTRHLFGYETDIPSHQFLLNYAFHDQSIKCSEPETLYTNRIKSAVGYLGQKVKIQSLNDCIKLLKKITERLLFPILILNDIGDRTVDVSMAFETLNFRGKTLSKLELFKNRVLFLISKTSFSRESKQLLTDRVIACWLNLYRWLGENPDRELEDDEFLKAFWILYFSEDDYVSKDFENWSEDLFENRFSLNTKNENDYISNSGSSGIYHWTKVLDKAIELWFFIKNPYEYKDNKSANFEATDDICDLLFKIRSFPNNLGSYTQVLILAIFMRKLPRKMESLELGDDFNQNLELVTNLLKAIERHNVACFLLNGNKANYNKENIWRCVNAYYKRGVGSQLYAGSTYSRDLEEYLRDHLVKNISFSDIKNHTHKEQFRFKEWNGLSYVLLNYEINKAREIGRKLLFKDLRNLTWNYKLIYPTDYKGDSFIDFRNLRTENKKRYCFSLGNIILSKNDNGHRNFQELIEQINQSSSKTASEEYLKFHFSEDWNKNTVLQRGKEIFTFIVKNWELVHVSDIREPANYSNAKWQDLLLDIKD